MALATTDSCFCQNKLCRHQFTLHGFAYPEKFSINKYRDSHVCPKCGFKSGRIIDEIGIKELMKQAVIDHPELLELKLP